MIYFTERQTAVAKLAAAGLCQKEIAQALGISLRMVKDHLANIYIKIGAKGLGARYWLMALMWKSNADARKSEASDATVSSFTKRETAVAKLIGRGLCRKEIAQALRISRRTVSHRLARIYRKIGADGVGARYRLLRFMWETDSEARKSEVTATVSFWPAAAAPRKRSPARGFCSSERLGSPRFHSVGTSCRPHNRSHSRWVAWWNRRSQSKRNLAAQ